MPIRAGDPAPSFELQDTTGHVHRLQEYRGNWLLLVMLRHLG